MMPRRLDAEPDDQTSRPQRPPFRRRSGDVGMFGKIQWGIVIQVLSWIIAAFVTYNLMTQRLSVVETQMKDFKEQQDAVAVDLREIRGDIKELLKRRP